jgi:putative oxidoreductase
MQNVAKQLTKSQDVAFLLLRVGVGVIMLSHGTMKLSDPTGTAAYFAQLGIPMPSAAVVLAIAGEFVGGLGLLLGALTRVAALGPLCTMIVAIGTVHAGHGLFAQNGGWEYPMTILLVSLTFVFRGAGRYSLDTWFARRRHPELRQAERYPDPAAV